MYSPRSYLNVGQLRVEDDVDQIYARSRYVCGSQNLTSKLQSIRLFANGRFCFD